MKTFAAIALASTVVAQSCSESRDGTFNIQITNVTSSSEKRDLSARQLSGRLTVSLKDGVLKDQAGRTGNVVANHQFQFDSPLQDGSIYADGFGICPNGTLTHQGSAIWYQCLSGTFYNLYDQSQGAQCNQVYFNAVGGSSAPVTQLPDGQPGAPTDSPVTQIIDGQPQAPTGVVSQIIDGQPQAPTGVVTQIADGQPQGPVVTQIADGQPQGPVVSQIADGQPQGPVVSQIADGQPQGPVVSQIADGQPQAPAGPVVSQIADGQPQAPAGPVVTQIADGQPQAPAGTSAPAPSGPVVSQISDGQPQAPTGPVVSQISDGQPQAPVATGNITTPNVSAPVEFPGTASQHMAGAGAFVAALLAMVTLL